MIDVDLTLGEYKIVHRLVANVGSFVTYRMLYDRLRYEGFMAGIWEDGFLSKNIRLDHQAHPQQFPRLRPRLRRDRELHRLLISLAQAILGAPASARFPSTEPRASLNKECLPLIAFLKKCHTRCSSMSSIPCNGREAKNRENQNPTPPPCRRGRLGWIEDAIGWPTLWPRGPTLLLWSWRRPALRLGRRRRWQPKSLKRAAFGPLQGPARDIRTWQVWRRSILGKLRPRAPVFPCE